jgi:hypothetical protein
MLYTNVIEHRGGTLAAILPAGVRLDGRVDDFSELRMRLAAERAIDDVLADSFPASDPPSWNPGVTRPEPVVSVGHRSPRSEPTASDGATRVGVIDVSRPTLGERTFIDGLTSLAGAAGIALLVPFAILLIGVPVVLAARGLLGTIGWRFGVVVRETPRARRWAQESAPIRL